jgi:hypothetical protein
MLSFVRHDLRLIGERDHGRLPVAVQARHQIGRQPLGLVKPCLAARHVGSIHRRGVVDEDDAEFSRTGCVVGHGPGKGEDQSQQQKQLQEQQQIFSQPLKRGVHLQVLNGFFP